MPDEPAVTVTYFDHDVSPYKDMMSLFQCMGDEIAVHSRYGIDDGSARFRMYVDGKQTLLDMPTFRQLLGDKSELLILTNEPYITVNQLFNRQNRGRMMALFANPVHRTIQQFMEREENDKTTLLEWIDRADDNIYIKKLLGKSLSDSVDLVDLQMAKEFIRQSVVVGLSSEMKESLNRFNGALGVGDAEMRSNARCLEEIFKENEVGVDKFVKMVSKHLDCSIQLM